MTKPIHHKDFEAVETMQIRSKMAAKIVETAFQVDGPFELKQDLRKKIFWPMVWWLTEAGGKHGIRFRSTAALGEAAIENIRHEHVFPISHLYYLSRHGMSVSDALSLACGCLVTRSEHDRLSQLDRKENPPLGWLRYVEAEIPVFDMLEKRSLRSDELAAMTQGFAKAMEQARFCGDGEVDLELDRKAKAAGEVV